MTSLASVDAQLSALLRCHATGPCIKTDEPGLPYVELPSSEPDAKARFFSAVRIKKAYVSDHLMPVYENPDLRAGMTDALRARMRGKSCFNFTASIQSVLRNSTTTPAPARATCGDPAANEGRAGVHGSWPVPGCRPPFKRVRLHSPPMTALLLRLLLITSLVLNGSGAAMASVRMAQQLPGMGAVPVGSHSVRSAAHAAADAIGDAHGDPVAQSASMPCHDMPRAAAAERTQGASTPARSPDKQTPAAPSHCDGGTCQCACLHIAQAMTTLSRVPALAVGASTMPQPGIDAHVDPALPHLIRPPIA